MATIKRRKGKKTEQDSNLPVPLQDNSKEVKNGERSENPTGVEEQIGQHHTRTILIPEETLVVEESRFEKPHFIIQTALTAIGFFTLIGFVCFSIIQHGDALDALKLAKQNFDSSDSATKKSIELAERSLSLTRQSLDLAQRNFEIENRPHLSIKQIDHHIIRGFLTADVQVLNVGKSPAYDIKHVGGTKTGGTGVYETDWKVAETNKSDERNIAESGLPFSQITVEEKPLTSQDSLRIFTGSRHWFVFGIFRYKDIFDKPHWTRYCVTFDTTIGQFKSYIRYNDVDRYEKKQTTTQADR